MNMEKALDRLRAPYYNGKKLNRKDVLIILAIMAIYSIIAFTNLGSFIIPSTEWKAKSTKDELIFRFDDIYDISYFKYYTGLGAGAFDIYYSADGINYNQYILTEQQQEDIGTENDTIVHSELKMFAWNFYDFQFRAKYVKIDIKKTGVRFREMAFCTEDGLPVDIVSLTNTNTKNADGIDALIDEQSQVPVYTSYLENMYFDEVYHARTAIENIEHIRPYEITHPPLGKIIIGIGIRIFGENPFGWRFMGTLTGVLMLPLMYIFAKRIFRKTLYAFIPTFLFAVDFMHFAQTRISTIDSYSILFIMLMYFFMYEYVNRNYNRDGLKKTLLPLGACGIAFGLGAATKWLCIYAGLGLAVIFFYSMFQRYAEYRVAKKAVSSDLSVYSEDEAETLSAISRTYVKNTVLTLVYCIGMFIIIPAGIYLLSYIPYVLVKNNPYDFKQILENQTYMFNYHATLTTETPHPFNSRWYTWVFDVRPVYFFQGKGLPEGTISSLSTFGNPIVWWGGYASVIFILVNRLRKKKFARGIMFVCIAALSEFLPWIIISRETFIYHYFATVPFLILILTFALKYIYENFKHGKKFVIGYLILSGVIFAAFYPVITGTIAPRWYTDILRWLPTWPFY
ncbi:MAG: phospholipid carrier-dependent glycosyltransferase [Eubacteriales bacterium]